MPAAERTRVERLTTTEGAVLALLATEGERSGYDLAKLVERAIGHVWSPARSGLYATLPRLAKSGLVESRAIVQSAKPDKQLYRISKAGREALARGSKASSPARATRSSSSSSSASSRRRTCCSSTSSSFATDTEARLAVLREIAPTNTNRGHDWFHRHLLEYGIRCAELDLEWADGVARALRRGPR